MAFLEESDNLQANARTENLELRTKNLARGFSPLSVGKNPLAPLSGGMWDKVNATDYSTRYPTVYGKKL
jgi:hypothetical protein